jgi:hypothetical protein
MSWCGLSDKEIIEEVTYLFKDPTTMFIQRRYGIGYARASHILAAIEKGEKHE